MINTVSPSLTVRAKCSGISERMKFSMMDSILIAQSFPMNTDRREFLPLSKMRNKKKEPPSSTENSKDFDSIKQKSEPPMMRNSNFYNNNEDYRPNAKEIALMIREEKLQTQHEYIALICNEKLNIHYINYGIQEEIK